MLQEEIDARNARLESMAAGFPANAPKAFYMLAERLQAEVDAKTAELAEFKRAARVAELTASRDAYADFRAMLEGMVRLDGERLVTIRTSSRTSLPASWTGPMARAVT